MFSASTSLCVWMRFRAIKPYINQSPITPNGSSIKVTVGKIEYFVISKVHACHVRFLYLCCILNIKFSYAMWCRHIATTIMIDLHENWCIDIIKFLWSQWCDLFLYDRPSDTTPEKRRRKRMEKKYGESDTTKGR